MFQGLGAQAGVRHVLVELAQIPAQGGRLRLGGLVELAEDCLSPDRVGRRPPLAGGIEPSIVLACPFCRYGLPGLGPQAVQGREQANRPCTA